jgi:PAS domain S-box-containing protein
MATTNPADEQKDHKFRYVVELAATALVYFIAGKLGLALAYGPQPVSTIWPASGIALATLVIFGAGLWPGVLLGAFLVNITSSESIATAAAIAVGNTLEAVIGVKLLHLLRFDGSLKRIRDVFSLFFVAGIFSTLVSATIGTAALYFRGLRAEPFTSTWLHWWVGDAGSIWVFAPLLLTFFNKSFSPASRIWETATVFVLLLAVCLINFVTPVEHEGGLKYVIFPVLVWSGLRLGQFKTALACAIVKGIAVWGVIQGSPAFGTSTDLAFRYDVLALFSGVLSSMALTLGAIATEKDLAVNALLQRDAELKLAMSAGRMGNWEWNVATGRITWSEDLEAIHGFKKGTSPTDFPAYLESLHPDDRQQVSQAIERAVRETNEFSIQYRCRPDMGMQFFAARGYAIRDAEGKPVRMVGLCADVTARMLAEEKLRASEARFRSIFEQAAVGVSEADSVTGHYIRVNQRYCDITGYTNEELLQRTFFDVTHPDDQKDNIELLRRLLAGAIQKFDVEKRYIRKDGGIVWVHVTVSPMWLPGEKPTHHIAVIEDITGRKHTEETLRASEAKYRELVENANSIILRMDNEGRITFFNEFAERFFGFTQKEMLGRNVIGTIVPSSDSVGKDMRAMIANIAAHPERYANNENENIRRTGERVWIAWTNKPIFASDGTHVEVLCIGNDITRLKRTEHELIRARDAAESADRVKSAFLATMSHELRTPLNSIIGFTGILLQGLAGPLSDEQRKQLQMVKNSSHHLLALINDVLDISKIEAGQLEVRDELFNMREAIKKSVQCVEPQAAKKNISVETKIADNVGPMFGDQRRVEQVLMNLLSNAVKFTEQGSIRVNCEARDGILSISVEDTGIGIEPQHQADLFRPFHQIDTGLSRKHEGTGLGLSISKRLVELMGGSISLKSEFGKGSVFTVTLPC